MKTILLIILVFLTQPLPADSLEDLKDATLLANSRLTDGIFMERILDANSFEKQASQQIEFALISINRRDLLTEEWFDMALYCLARKHKKYSTALKILKKEYSIEKYPKLTRWLKSRIELLSEPEFNETNFSISAEFADFRKKVF